MSAIIAEAITKEQLQSVQEAGTRLKFRFFWGHTGQGIGPHVLSQWYEAPFEVHGLRYPTAEHWMMAEKARFFGDENSVNAILHAKTPGAAKALGRKVRGFEEGEWCRVRSAIVRNGNLEKFRQNPALAEWLLNTGEMVLVEASPTDAIWGIAMSADHPDAERISEWCGQNLLGFALMEVRRRLRNHPHPRLPPNFMSPPWLQFQGVPPYSLFWRMGAGEEYLLRFGLWWQMLSNEERIEVEMLHPAIGAWEGWYL